MKLLFFLLIPHLIFAASNKKLHALYSGLKQDSVAEHLAFYELYPESVEGKKALSDAWTLMSDKTHSEEAPLPTLPSAIHAIISLVNKDPTKEIPILTEPDLSLIETLANRLPNRKLKGHRAKSRDEVLALPPHEVDIARGVFLSQMGEENMQKIRSYEAAIDLMALQILARLQKDAKPETKIHTINAYIFDELGFRFPPHSLFAKDVDQYTFLPSVLDSRHGVCLGVSILYHCLADRLDLTLETITPPGHIYVRHRDGDKILNIETTARGVNIPCEQYLGIDTKALQERSRKDVIGLAHMNEAATSWQNGEHQKAIDAYTIAQKFLPEDPLLKGFMAFNLLQTGEKEHAEKLLLDIVHHTPEESVSKDTLPEDYLNHRVDAEGIGILFQRVDETRESIENKRKALESVLNEFPKFRQGHFQLAVCWLQLHRQKEALTVLKKLHALDNTDPTVEYYLTLLHLERKDYPQAAKHFEHLTSLLDARVR